MFRQRRRLKNDDISFVREKNYVTLRKKEQHMKRILLFTALMLSLLSCGAPTEVENAVDEANLECPVNLMVAQIESVELEDENIVYTVSCGQIVRNLMLSAPEHSKKSVIALLKTGGGQGFDRIVEVAKEYGYNIVIRVEDENDEFDPVDLTATPEDISKIDTGNIQLNLFN